MGKLIAFFIANFTLTFFILGIIHFLLIQLFRKKPIAKGAFFESFFVCFLLWNIGVSFFYNFVMHVFFGNLAAEFIGWANSPFQLEVGFASLGFSVVGFIATRASLSFRAAAIIGPLCFLWGAAGGHIYQFITAHNYSPGNIGVIFWSDLLIPLIGLILLVMSKSFEHRSQQ